MNVSIYLVGFAAAIGSGIINLYIMMWLFFGYKIRAKLPMPILEEPQTIPLETEEIHAERITESLATLAEFNAPAAQRFAIKTYEENLNALRLLNSQNPAVQELSDLLPELRISVSKKIHAANVEADAKAPPPPKTTFKERLRSITWKHVIVWLVVMQIPVVFLPGFRNSSPANSVGGENIPDELKISAAMEIQRRGLWCPKVASIDESMFGGSQNRREFNIFCDDGKGAQGYVLITDRNGNPILIRER